MEVIKINDKEAISKAIDAIKNGGVVVFPTDTVYGLICDSGNKKAIEKIFKLKKRPRSKPLALFIKDMKTAKKLATIGKKEEKILRKYWPGKYTFILKSKIQNPKSKIVLSKLVIGKYGTVALRIPKYKFLNDLLKKINKPLAQTSVNVSGKQPLTKIKVIQETIAGMDSKILIINGGDFKKAKPSKIIDLTSKSLTILR